MTTRLSLIKSLLENPGELYSDPNKIMGLRNLMIDPLTRLHLNPTLPKGGIFVRPDPEPRLEEEETSYPISIETEEFDEGPAPVFSQTVQLDPVNIFKKPTTKRVNQDIPLFDFYGVDETEESKVPYYDPFDLGEPDFTYQEFEPVTVKKTKWRPVEQKETTKILKFIRKAISTDAKALKLSRKSHKDIVCYIDKIFDKMKLKKKYSRRQKSGLVINAHREFSDLGSLRYEGYTRLREALGKSISRAEKVVCS